ncbi:hypothetical protein DQ04_10001020 [Trypanosoma grayi]|uniref:hypothetical protein n=1 Tax=Trypanosoma grayi TaxID=71804 RepID=UPI0004F478D4|nr:hypothetical protein DQ04_10001020 [Trypanosoma grayi]KEG07372.1 hypothetical protein DQ04_10001020 [Trypanosoma grayi]
MTNTKGAKNKKTSKGQVEQQQQQQQQGKKAAGEANGGADVPHPFLGRELRVELTDRRVIAGTLIAFMGHGDLLLQNAVEQRCYADGEVSCRPLTLVAVPFQHVMAMHRRLPGCDPIALAEG